MTLKQTSFALTSVSVYVFFFVDFLVSTVLTNITWLLHHPTHYNKTGSMVWFSSFGGLSLTLIMLI